ncbi:unnamed protein product [Arabidopsis lyrata]|uniref:putative methylesterase 14, chloroplastic n=1 Tax=Arabidopsis lyrata subsp. lyrata TaxID=81972 RepID=UPI000A29A6FF|nr:putative methylesterase 14, chloroplastic [Arabidopsis lyrata subsp. lyrata]CAH8277389.1 unnamed protein product [Arabidopsis lyrata]|eukprot:XP_002862327.2 putative methylesterase 14, chloroplastic [Arabidopsis lyrata subsp. lyrata]
MASSSLTSFPCLSSLKMTIKPMAALTNPPRTKTPYELKKGQNRLFHKLPSGLKMEVIEQRRSKSERENPPLVFVHGSYHAAWCWAEHWLPFFSSSGFDSYAVSLLGQGESDDPLGTVAGTLQTHASDIADFIELNLGSSPPVLIGHSFGGLIVQYYLANIVNKQTLGTENAFPELSGVVLVCSVPPSGNSGLVLRYLFSKPVAAFKDDEGLKETGRFYEVEPVCIEGVAHDMMLDCSWEKGAEVLLSWLCGLSKPGNLSA